MTDIERISFDEVVLRFAELEDPRSTVNRQHPLVIVVVIAVMAVLAGANGPTAIARWATLKEKFLLVLRLVGIREAIITIDATGAQKSIAGKIIDGRANYVLTLKGNQGTLHQAIIDHIVEQFEADLEGAQELVTTEKGHGREETRTYLLLPAPKGLSGFALWKPVKTITVVTLLCVRDGKETIEVRYYLSSLAMDVKRLARTVRGHWGIENSCHWVLDVTYREDESRIREEALRENFAWLNRFTLSLFKQHPDRASIAMKRRSCGWNENYLLQVITGGNDLVCAGPVSRLSET
jgi:predicted transposase YbfD/YdcC